MQKIALVTGCSSGIGRATSLEFARAGFHTFASMRNVSKGRDLEELANKENLSLEVIELDVLKLDTINKTFEKIISEKKRLDVLINNAGFMIMGSLEDVDIEDFNLQWRTDFLGPIIMMKKAIPIMREQEVNENGIRGNIVNVSSIAGKIPFAYASAYIASKFALEGLSECVFDEVSDKGIKINIIEPGVVKTNFFKNTKTIIKDNSPYMNIVNEWNTIAKKLFDVTNNTPEDVAKIILKCVTDPSSDLRIPIGDDARLFLDMYHQFSDEPLRFKKWFTDEMQKMLEKIKGF
ncbi:MAG: SDR family oxidoreductase [Nitrosarchaeum sp.]|nr:SDR family oxidoreductase [Nitrosarchaeum sp.]